MFIRKDKADVKVKFTKYIDGTDSSHNSHHRIFCQESAFIFFSPHRTGVTNWYATNPAKHFIRLYRGKIKKKNIQIFIIYHSFLHMNHRLLCLVVANHIHLCNFFSWRHFIGLETSYRAKNISSETGQFSQTFIKNFPHFIYLLLPKAVVWNSKTKQNMLIVYPNLCKKGILTTIIFNNSYPRYFNTGGLVI